MTIATREPYLPLPEALARVAEDAPVWVRDHQPVAHRDGWNFFNLEPLDEVHLDAGIQRYDVPSEWDGCERRFPFASDGDVIRHCQQQAERGSETHAFALRLEHAMNSVRFHTWGADYVDSRCGPADAA